MKKLLTGVLALALAASVGVTAFAATTDGKSPVTGEVQGIYKEGEEAPETIVVDVTWDDMTFTYREAAKDWNPDTHEYDQPDGQWDATPKYITVTNHSNINVLCSITCEWSGNIVGGFDMTTNYPESTNSMTLNSLKNGVYNQWKQAIFVTGGKLAKDGDIGTITVAVSSFE